MTEVHGDTTGAELAEPFTQMARDVLVGNGELVATVGDAIFLVFDDHRPASHSWNGCGDAPRRSATFRRFAPAFTRVRQSDGDMTFTAPRSMLLRAWPRKYAAGRSSARKRSPQLAGASVKAPRATELDAITAHLEKRAQARD